MAGQKQAWRQQEAGAEEAGREASLEAGCKHETKSKPETERGCKRSKLWTSLGGVGVNTGKVRCMKFSKNKSIFKKSPRQLMTRLAFRTRYFCCPTSLLQVD